jgi:hypothetical protein
MFSGEAPTPLSSRSFICVSASVSPSPVVSAGNSTYSDDNNAFVRDGHDLDDWLQAERELSEATPAVGQAE